MHTELGQKLYRKCQLDQELQTLERETRALNERLPEAKAAKREADAALLEYEAGGVRAFLDKLAGKREEKKEALKRGAAAADSALRQLKREIELSESGLAAIAAEREALGIGADPVELARTLEPEERDVILRRIALTQAKKLLPLLGTAENALEEAQEWARPNNRIDIAPGYTKGKLLAQAEKDARECCACLEDMERCGILLEIHPYFQNPSGYIHGVASQFAELDRINQALSGIRQTKSQTKELLLQLTEE